MYVLPHVSKNTVFSSVAIRGLYYTKPGHSCIDIRDSGDSKGDGKYWIDPEKRGNPLNVFCDMKTDGGKTRMYKQKGNEIVFFINFCTDYTIKHPSRITHRVLAFSRCLYCVILSRES